MYSLLELECIVEVNYVQSSTPTVNPAQGLSMIEWSIGLSLTIVSQF